MPQNAATAKIAACDDYATLCRQAAGTNIDSNTLLATDYLNHFNEVVMLLEMVVDVPDCLDMVSDWRPKSYQEHFRDSGFSDKNLAIRAYDHVPSCFLTPFEQTVECLNHEIRSTIAHAASHADTAKANRFREEMTDKLMALKSLIDAAGAIIHGSASGLEQDQVDALFDD